MLPQPVDQLRELPGSASPRFAAPSVSITTRFWPPRLEMPERQLGRGLDPLLHVRAPLRRRVLDDFDELPRLVARDLLRQQARLPRKADQRDCVHSAPAARPAPPSPAAPRPRGPRAPSSRRYPATPSAAAAGPRRDRWPRPSSRSAPGCAVARADAPPARPGTRSSPPCPARIAIIHRVIRLLGPDRVGVRQLPAHQRRAGQEKRNIADVQGKSRVRAGPRRLPRRRPGAPVAGDSDGMHCGKRERAHRREPARSTAPERHPWRPGRQPRPAHRRKPPV